MPARIGALALGAALAAIVRTDVDLSQLKRAARWMLPATAIAVAPFLLVRGEFDRGDTFVQSFGYTAVALDSAAAHSSTDPADVRLVLPVFSLQDGRFLFGPRTRGR
jgi:hypothetical protein